MLHIYAIISIAIFRDGPDLVKPLIFYTVNAKIFSYLYLAILYF